MITLTEAQAVLAAILGSNLLTAIVTGSVTRRTESDRMLLEQVKVAWSELHAQKAECDQLRQDLDELRAEYDSLRAEFDALVKRRRAVNIA